MISKLDKNQDRVIRHARVRKKVNGTEARPRLCVYRSTNHIYAQVIDDVKGNTLCAASTLEKDVAAKVADLSKSEAAKVVGKAVTVLLEGFLPLFREGNKSQTASFMVCNSMRIGALQITGKIYNAA